MIDRLYREHGHLVLRRARQILGNESEARDACQDVFLSLLDRPSQIDGVTRITAWLYQATTHRCLNVLRNRRGRARLLAVVEPVATVPPRSEEMAQVRELLGRLPPPLGEIAIYLHVDGMTHEEIAHLLACSRRHVGDLIQKLRAAVRRADVVRQPLRSEEQET